MDEETLRIVSRDMSCEAHPLSEAQIAFYREQLVGPLKCLEQMQTNCKSPAIQAAIDDMKKELNFLKEQENMLKAEKNRNVIDKKPQTLLKRKVVRPAVDSECLPPKSSKKILQNIKAEEISLNKDKVIDKSSQMPFKKEIIDAVDSEYIPPKRPKKFLDAIKPAEISLNKDKVIDKSAQIPFKKEIIDAVDSEYIPPKRPKKFLDAIKPAEISINKGKVIDKSAQMPFKKEIIDAVDSEYIPPKRPKKFLDAIKPAEISINKDKLIDKSAQMPFKKQIRTAVDQYLLPKRPKNCLENIKPEEISVNKDKLIDKSAQMPFKKEIRAAVDSQCLQPIRANNSLPVETSVNKGKRSTDPHIHSGGNTKFVNNMSLNSMFQDTTVATTSVTRSCNENIFKKSIVPPTVKAKTNRRRPAFSLPNSGAITSAVNPIICESNAFGGIKIKMHNESTAITYQWLCRNYPTLCVNVKPYLRGRNLSETSSNLEEKVKSTLLMDNKKFFEFLLSEGLIKHKQMCVNQPTIEMNLGVYSDTLKFYFSGGYAWFSECCPNQYVSVYHGSIFENATRPPKDIFKLVYHWVYQSSIENIMTWVNVNCDYIQNAYTWFRSLCTLGLHTKCRQIGGARRHVEVGLVTLSMQTSAGLLQKVEIVGAYDRIAQKIRLCSFEPNADNFGNELHFRKLLSPIGDWIQRDSIICLDFSINPAIVRNMGFQNILQMRASTEADEQSNATIMNYLSITLPEFFNNVLDVLSSQTIQQFLDELVWREWFGTCNFQAYKNIIDQLIEVTVKTSPSSFHPRFQQIALNPHNDWNKTFKYWSSYNLNLT